MNKLGIYLDPASGAVQVQSESLRPVEALEVLVEAQKLILAAVKRTIQEDLGFGVSDAAGGFIPFDPSLDAESLLGVASYSAQEKGN